jgi:hypothetical protein
LRHKIRFIACASEQTAFASCNVPRQRLKFDQRDACFIGAEFVSTIGAIVLAACSRTAIHFFVAFEAVVLPTVGKVGASLKHCFHIPAQFIDF